METSFLYFAYAAFLEFKSYYVVWKPYKDNYSVSENTIV